MSHELNLNQAATHKMVGFPAQILCFVWHWSLWQTDLVCWAFLILQPFDFEISCRFISIQHTNGTSKLSLEGLPVCCKKRLRHHREYRRICFKLSILKLSFKNLGGQMHFTVNQLQWLNNLIFYLVFLILLEIIINISLIQ